MNQAADASEMVVREYKESPRKMSQNHRNNIPEPTFLGIQQPLEHISSDIGPRNRGLVIQAPSMKEAIQLSQHTFNSVNSRVSSSSPQKPRHL